MGQGDRRNHILFCQLEGLLAVTAEQARFGSVGQVPVLVAEDRIVRDVSPAAARFGIKVGQSISLARRLCPAALVVPLADVNYRDALRPLLDILADASPVVEPAEPDGAYADLFTAGGSCESLDALCTIAERYPSCRVRFGQGPSRVAARACAECNLSPNRLADANVQWLWEDPAVTKRLFRLGLVMFGAVAQMPESFLVQHFGKIGRLLHRRAHGQDLTPVRALYPPLRADVFRSLEESPVSDRERLDGVLGALAGDASTFLTQHGRHGKRVRLLTTTEDDSGALERERLLALPVQSAPDIARIASRLLDSCPINAPVTSLRLLVEELDIPISATASLFEGEGRGTTKQQIESVKRYLLDRYGNRSLLTLRDIPIPLAETRRALVEERLRA